MNETICPKIEFVRSDEDYKLRIYVDGMVAPIVPVYNSVQANDFRFCDSLEKLIEFVHKRSYEAGQQSIRKAFKELMLE